MDTERTPQNDFNLVATLMYHCIAKMTENSHKLSWRAVDLTYLTAKRREEEKEFSEALANALAHQSPENVKKLWREAADVANTMAFLCDYLEQQVEDKGE